MTLEQEAVDRVVTMVKRVAIRRYGDAAPQTELWDDAETVSALAKEALGRRQREGCSRDG